MEKMIFKNRLTRTLILMLGVFWMTGYSLDAQPLCAVEILQKADPNQPGVVYLAAAAKGEAPFQYLWSTGDSTQRIQVTQPGQYCVTISDAIGCTSRACAIVDSVGTNCAVEIVKTQGGTGTNTQATILTANGKGAMPFKYQWSTGETTQKIQVDSAGLYCVTITDTTGCEASECIRVVDPQNDVCDVAIRRIELRIPGTTGILLLAEAKGMEPYTFEWSNGATGRALLVTTSGEYCVKMTDAKGCMARACIQITIATPQTCAVQILQRQIPGPLGGTLLVAMPTGLAPYQFKWNTGVLNRVLFVNRPGEYCVTMVDATGCEAKACIRVGNPQNDSCAVEIIQRPSPSAAGREYILQAVPKGVGPFKYRWDNGDTTNFIKVTDPGRYCVKVIDATGCIASACFVIPDANCAARISMTIDSTNTGLVATLTANAKGQAPFKYEWSTGETTQSIRVQNDSTYCVTVVDSTGCETKACIDVKLGNRGGTLGDSCAVQIALKRTTSNAGVFLVAEAKGKGPFTYEWSTGETTREIVATQLGKYCVVVTAANGCKTRACVNWDGRGLSPALTSGGATEFEYSVYPNPAYGRLVLQRREQAETALVRIMRRDGQVVLRTEWPGESTEWTIDVQSLMPGTYFVQVITRNSVNTKTFFKQ